MWCVCARATGTDDHRLGGSSEHRCVTFGVRSLKSVSWGQKQGVGGCVPPRAEGRLGLCLFSFWRRLHYLANRPPSIVKPLESASPSQAALAPSWLGELSAQGVVGSGGALILRAGTAVTPAEPWAPDAAELTSWSLLLGSVSVSVHVCVCPHVRETLTLWTWDHVLCL